MEGKGDGTVLSKSSVLWDNEERRSKKSAEGGMFPERTLYEASSDLTEKKDSGEAVAHNSRTTRVRNRGCRLSTGLEEQTSDTTGGKLGHVCRA